MTTKVVKGSLWTLAGQIAPLAVSLVATPFVIRLLGAESYGVLILIGLIPTYLGFADFGMSMASTRFGSEAYAEGDEEKEARIVRTAALIALMTSVPVAAALMIFAPQIIGLFNVPEALQAEAATALRIAAVTFVVNFLCGIFNTPQLARLRMDLNTFINAGSRILGLIATPIVLYLGYGLIGAVTVLLLASLLNITGHVVISYRLLPRVVGTTIDKRMRGSILKFGAEVVAGAIAGLFLINAEKGVLAASVSPIVLAHYSVAFALAGMVTLFSGAMIQSLIPAFSQLQGHDKREQLQSIFSRGIKISLLWVVPTMVFLAFIAQPFFTIWAGAEFGEASSWPLYFLLFGLIFNIFAYLPHSILLASGRTDVLAKLYWMELLPYILIVWVLSSNYGASGAAIAWSIRVIIDATIQFLFVIKISRLFLPKVILNGIAFGVISMVIPTVSIMAAGGISIFVGIMTCLSLGTFALFAFRFLIEKEEIDWVLSLTISRFKKV